MYTSLLRKANLLPLAILVFLLFGSAYVVLAQGQTTSQSDRVSGMCYIRTANTNVPGLSGPDVGNGYARIVKSGVYTIERLRVVCTKADYDTLIDKICAKNHSDTEQYMGGEVSDNVSTIGGCTASGCEIIRRCPIPLLPSPQPPTPAEEKTFTYPISELGGCNDMKECHVYCEEPGNNRACFGFVKKHKLIPKDELDRWEEFLDVATGRGPGGCKDEWGCINYCEDVAHIVECTDFVAKHNLVSAQELAEMQKIAKALKVGAKLPGNCRNKIECISYCEDSAHTEECVSFLQKAGFMTEKEAGLVRKFKGKSPGDCAKGSDSFAEAQVSCNAFCNDPTNQPICFKFLEEAGIMTAEETTQAGSLSDFQACVPSAPQEIQQCFIDNLGQNLFDAMKKGVLPLEGDVESFMVKIRAARQCVNRFADQTIATFTDNPEALSCINSELGKDYLEKAKRGEVKCGDAAQSQKKVELCIETAMSVKLDHCFSLACSEATTCFQSLQESSNGQEEGKSDPALEEKINAKMIGCNTPQQQDQESRVGQQPSAEQIPQEYCSSFTSVPNCSYVGSPDSDNYKYCKQCYPDK